MKIGFDAKRLFHNHTGLGVYSRLLLTGLIELNTDDAFLLFAKNPMSSKYYQDFSDLPIIESSQPLWRTWGVVRAIQKNGCQIFHGLSNELPVDLNRAKTKTIVTIHDVIFKKDKKLYPWIDRMIYDLKWTHSVKASDLIIAVSQSTKSDLCDYYGVNEDKIRVVYPPVRKISPIIDISQIKSRYKLPEKFYLTVGSLTLRKNIMAVLKAMYITKPEQRIPLVIIGSGREKKTLQQFCWDHKLDSLVYFLGHVDDDELAAFYQTAYALIYPSLYEGFGIPIVESLINRTPVITSKTSSMPEAAGDGGLLIDPEDPEEIALAMQRLLENTALYKKLAREGNLHAQKFKPVMICEQQMKLYNML